MTENELDELLTFEQLVAKLDPNGDKGITLNTIIKWTKQETNPLPVKRPSPNKQFVRLGDYNDWINGKTNKEPEIKPSNKLMEVDEQIQLVKKEQELEALKAGFKNVDDYKLALSAVLSEQTKLAEQKEKYETSFKSLEVDRKAFELFKKEGEGEIAQGKAKNLEEKEKVLKIGKDYKKKWDDEDKKRKSENELMVIHLDELAKDIYNLPPQYLGKIAKERLASHIEPLLTYYGLPPVFNKKGEYLSLTSRINFEGTDDITKERKDATGVLDGSQMVANVKGAYTLIVSFYKWVLQVQGGYEFATWLYKELNTMNSMLDGKEPNEIEQSMNTLMEHYGAINRGMIELAGRFDKSNHPNTVSDSAEVTYILRMSDEIERLLGITSGEE